MSEQKKGIDISDITSTSEEVAEQLSSEAESMNSIASATEEQLLAVLQETDPTTALIYAKISDFGNIVADLLERMNQAEVGLTFLLSQNPQYVEGIKKAKEKMEQAAQQSKEPNDQPSAD